MSDVAGLRGVLDQALSDLIGGVQESERLSKAVLALVRAERDAAAMTGPTGRARNNSRLTVTRGCGRRAGKTRAEADVLVWALTDLLLGGSHGPQARML